MKPVTAEILDLQAACAVLTENCQDAEICMRRNPESLLAIFGSLRWVLNKGCSAQWSCAGTQEEVLLSPEEALFQVNDDVDGDAMPFEIDKPLSLSC